MDFLYWIYVIVLSMSNIYIMLSMLCLLLATYSKFKLSGSPDNLMSHENLPEYESYPIRLKKKPLMWMNPEFTTDAHFFLIIGYRKYVLKMTSKISLWRHGYKVSDRNVTKWHDQFDSGETQFPVKMFLTSSRWRKKLSKCHVSDTLDPG